MGSKSTKQTTENKPPEWATPLFSQSASEAQKLYASGSGGNTYTGSTVAPLSGTTMGGINQLAQAGANWNTGASRPLFQGIGAAAAGPSSSQNNLAAYARGDYLDPAKNPYFSGALQDQLDKTASQVQSQFSGAGRYGSGANVNVLTDTLGKTRTAALSDQFAREQANQFAANAAIDSNRLQGLGLAQNAAQSIANQDQQQFQNRLAGAGATVQAGNMLDAQAQAQKADEVAKWYAEDNQDWARLGLLQAAAAGSAGNYGTQVATTRQPVGIGGILSGVGGLLGKSDARLKENIVPVGYRNGHVLWEFTYKGSPERFRGVMAQLVMDKQPEAVVMEADGFYAVDYAALGFPMERID